MPSSLSSSFDTSLSRANCKKIIAGHSGGLTTVCQELPSAPAHLILTRPLKGGSIFLFDEQKYWGTERSR